MNIIYQIYTEFKFTPLRVWCVYAVPLKKDPLMVYTVHKTQLNSSVRDYHAGYISSVIQKRTLCTLPARRDAASMCGGVAQFSIYNVCILLCIYAQNAQTNKFQS